MAREQWGSIRTLPSGRHQARYRADDGRMYTAPDTFASKSDARAWLAAKRTDLARGINIDDRAAKRTITEWWPTYIADAERRLKPSTVKTYREAWARIEPTFGKIAVGKIRPSAIDTWIGAMIDAGISPSRIRAALGVLSRLLDAAVRDRAIPSNPASTRAATIPATPPATRPVLTPTEVNELHSAAYLPGNADTRAQGHPHLPVLVSVLAWGGLRIGEALGLQRRDVDLTAGTITVNRSISEIDGTVHVTGTKTGRARTVTLPHSIIDELRAHLGTLPINPDAYLFPSRNGKPRRYRNMLRDLWQPMIDRINKQRTKNNLPTIDVMPHDLRSSCASVLIDAGASPKDVQHHLGHADITTTLNLYARVRPGRADDLAARMNQLISAPSPASTTDHGQVHQLPTAQ